MEVTEVKSVNIGNGQFFTFETRKQLGVAIAALSKALADSNLDRYEDREYVNFDTAYVALRDHYEKATPPTTSYRTLSRRTSQLWAAMVSAANTPTYGNDVRLTFHVMCARCGPSPLKAQHDVYGVWHHSACPSLRGMGYENYLISRDSILGNADDFDKHDYAGIGKTTKESYRALVQRLLS